MWREIPGYEGIYDVSDKGGFRRWTTNFGRVRDVPRRCRTGTRRGYRNITLCVNNEAKTFSAHRVVWEAFNGKIPEGMQINHKNGKKDDNRLSNLEVVTPSQNSRHAYEKKLRTVNKNPNPGARNGRAKLTEDDIREIFVLRGLGWSQQKIASKFGVDQTGISGILLRKTWAHVIL